MLINTKLKHILIKWIHLIYIKQIIINYLYIFEQSYI